MSPQDMAHMPYGPSSVLYQHHIVHMTIVPPHLDMSLFHHMLHMSLLSIHHYMSQQDMVYKPYVHRSVLYQHHIVYMTIVQFRFDMSMFHHMLHMSLL
jgi:hypothetical protein